MYSEIMTLQPPPRVYYDKTTQTVIGFMKYDSNDGSVYKGTWFTFNNKNSIKALINFIGKDIFIQTHSLTHTPLPFPPPLSSPPSLPPPLPLSAYHQLGGAFVYDISQDSISQFSGKYSFGLMEAVYKGLQGEGSGFICNPVVGCNVCYECCRSYLTNQFDCDACTAIRCPHPPN